MLRSPSRAATRSRRPGSRELPLDSGASQTVVRNLKAQGTTAYDRADSRAACAGVLGRIGQRLGMMKWAVACNGAVKPSFPPADERIDQAALDRAGDTSLEPLRGSLAHRLSCSAGRATGGRSRRAGVRPGGWRGASRAASGGIGRVIGLSRVTVICSPW